MHEDVKDKIKFGFREEIAQRYWFIDIDFTEEGVELTFEQGEHNKATIRVVCPWPDLQIEAIKLRINEIAYAMYVTGEL